jgi:hypothetical protein
MLIRRKADTLTAIYYRVAVGTLSHRASTGTSENYAYQMSITFRNTAHYSSSQATEKQILIIVNTT